MLLCSSLFSSSLFSHLFSPLFSFLLFPPLLSPLLFLLLLLITVLPGHLNPSSLGCVLLFLCCQHRPFPAGVYTRICFRLGCRPSSRRPLFPSPIPPLKGRTGPAGHERPPGSAPPAMGGSAEAPLPQPAGRSAPCPPQAAPKPLWSGANNRHPLRPRGRHYRPTYLPAERCCSEPDMTADRDNPPPCCAGQYRACLAFPGRPAPSPGPATPSGVGRSPP